MTPVFTADLRFESELNSALEDLDTYIRCLLREALIEATRLPEYAGERLVLNCSRSDQEWDFYVESNCDDLRPRIFDMMDMLTKLFDYALLPNVQMEALDGELMLEEVF